MNGYHVIDSQRFTSGRGNDALIDVARVQASDDRGYFVRVSIEAKQLAMIEVWSPTDLQWKELHTIPTPLVRPDLDQNLTELAKVGIAILKG